MKLPYCLNGFPKSGTRALEKAVSLLGLPLPVGHIPFTEGVPEGTTRHVFIKRDPRNVIIAALRAHTKPVIAGTFLSCMRSWIYDQSNDSIFEAMEPYEGWLNDSETFVIRYEDLIKDDTAMREIARYLDTPYLEGSFEYLPGLTSTWHPVHSDYRTLWDDQIEQQWSEAGGNDLLQRWGYL